MKLLYCPVRIGLQAKKEAEIEQRNAEIAKLQIQQLTNQNVQYIGQHYGELYTSTGDQKHLVAQQELYEEYFTAFPEDRRFLYNLAETIDRLNQDPRRAIEQYKDNAATIGWRNRFHMYYQPVRRVEFYHPGTMTTAELYTFFQAWSADLDTLKAESKNGKEQAPRSYRWNITEYRLWRAEIELARDGDITQAEQWLKRALAQKPSPDSTNETRVFNIYISPRAELRLGDIAMRRDDPQTAQQNYRDARKFLAPYKKDWSQELFYVYPDLREFGKLGSIIEERIE